MVQEGGASPSVVSVRWGTTEVSNENPLHILNCDLVSSKPTGKENGPTVRIEPSVRFEIDYYAIFVVDLPYDFGRGSLSNSALVVRLLREAEWTSVLKPCIYSRIITKQGALDVGMDHREHGIHAAGKPLPTNSFISHSLRQYLVQSWSQMCQFQNRRQFCVFGSRSGVQWRIALRISIIYIWSVFIMFESRGASPGGTRLSE